MCSLCCKKNVKILKSDIVIVHCDYIIILLCPLLTVASTYASLSMMEDIVAGQDNEDQLVVVDISPAARLSRALRYGGLKPVSC